MSWAVPSRNVSRLPRQTFRASLGPRRGPARRFLAPDIFRAQVDEFRRPTLKDLEPLITTFLKVVGGCLLLAQGNLLVIGAAVYVYRQYSKAQEELARREKAKVLAAIGQGEKKK